MYILTRYVVWEVLKFFVAARGRLDVGRLLSVLAYKRALELGRRRWSCCGSCPTFCRRSWASRIPVAMLYAVSSVFGRMTGANEIVALKSLGISPMAAVWPAVVLAAFLSLGTVCMYEIDATRCKNKCRQVFLDSIEDVLYSVLQKEKSFKKEASIRFLPR